MLRLTMAKAAEICARLINNESIGEIRRRTGAADRTIKTAMANLIEHGVPIKARERTPKDEGRAAEVQNLFLSTDLSNREIARRLGSSIDYVSKARRAYNKQVVSSGGELPRCGCGKYLHHPRLCRVRTLETMHARGVRSVRTLTEEAQGEVRRRLLAGETIRAVSEFVDLPKKLIHSYLLSFTPEEREFRRERFRIASAHRRAEALARKIDRPQSTQPAADPLYAQISGMVPRGIDPALRDDIISETYLAVLDGRVKLNGLAAGIKKARSRVFSAFASPWGPRSLDERDETGRSLMDRLAGTLAAT